MFLWGCLLVSVVGLCVFCSKIVVLFVDWWDVPIGCIVCLISGVSLFRGMFCMVWCFVLVSKGLFCFELFLFGGMLCSAVKCCLCVLFVVVCFCNVALAVLLFGCMFVVFWLSCFAVGNLVGLGCDWFGLCGWVGVWCCWECCRGWLFFYGSDVLFCL